MKHGRFEPYVAGNMGLFKQSCVDDCFIPGEFLFRFCNGWQKEGFQFQDPCDFFLSGKFRKAFQGEGVGMVKTFTQEPGFVGPCVVSDPGGAECFFDHFSIVTGNRFIAECGRDDVPAGVKDLYLAAEYDVEDVLIRITQQRGVLLKTLFELLNQVGAFPLGR